jgi:hypothetical protein
MCQVPKCFLDDVSAWLSSQTRHLAEDAVLTFRVIQGVDSILVQQVKNGK